MKFVKGLMKIVLGGIAAIVLLLGATYGVAQMSEGPIAIFPGGPLVEGEMIADEPDWTFARDIGEMEFQLENPAKSRTIWLLVHEKKLYIVSGYMNTPLGAVWKKWPMQAEKDGRAVIRIDGKRYLRTITRIRNEPALTEALAAEARRKYQVPMTAESAETGDSWFFRVSPRA